MVGNHFLLSEFLSVLKPDLVHIGLKPLAHSDNLLELFVANFDLEVLELDEYVNLWLGVLLACIPLKQLSVGRHKNEVIYVGVDRLVASRDPQQHTRVGVSIVVELGLLIPVDT